jgi:TonB family protein
MSGRTKTLAIILVFVWSALAPSSNPVVAQQRRAAYGPVVKAYLTGLDEELNELEYQLRQQEIGRADYARARQRLAMLRRAVERYASERREDIVPEYQVLAEDELGTVGLNREYKADELIDGAELDGRWKIVEVQFGGERKLTRFLVLERLPRAGPVEHESRLGKTVDPRDVIETVIVPAKTAPSATPPAPSTAAPDGQSAATDRAAPVETKTETAAALAKEPRLQSLRIVQIYLPEYTQKARDRKIEGEAVVLARFGADGKIKEAKVEKGLGFGLDDRAVEAVKRISFFPAQLDGKEVDAQARIVFDFRLEKVSVYVGAAELSAVAKGERF